MLRQVPMTARPEEMSSRSSNGPRVNCSSGVLAECLRTELLDSGAGEGVVRQAGEGQGWRGGRGECGEEG